MFKMSKVILKYGNVLKRTSFWKPVKLLFFRLSFEEFMGEETKAEKLFKLMDKDGDGYVTKAVSQLFD